MSANSVHSTDREGREIEVGSLIRYWRTEGWDGGRATFGVVTEIKPKTYLVREVMEMPATVGDDSVRYYVYADWRSPEPHRVAKERKQRWGGVDRPKLVHSAAEMEQVWAEAEEIKARLTAERETREMQQQAQREAEKAVEQKRRDINDAINAAADVLRARHREEFETLVADNYADKGVTVADLDAADAYFNHAYTVRPEGFTAVSV